MLATVDDAPAERPSIHVCHGMCVHLSDLDVEIIASITRGLNTDQTAVRLQRRRPTIKNRLSRLYSMLGVEDRTQLAVLALRSGIVEYAR